MIKQLCLWLCMLLGMLCVLLSACTATTPSPTPTLMPPTPTATKIATATPTAMPSLTPTRTLSPTPPPSPTRRPPPTFTPGPTPLPESVRGLRIAYTCDGNLCLYNGDTQEITPLTQEGTVAKPLFSPDGKKLLYHYYPSRDAVSALNSQLRLIDLETNAMTVLVEPAQLGENSIWEQVGWAPNGEIIAFNTLSATFDFVPLKHYDLWTVDVATGNLAQLLPPDRGGDFVFSPDGTHLTVSTPFTISMLRSDGSDYRTLVTFPLVDTNTEATYHPIPSWAVDSGYAQVAIPWPGGSYPSSEAYATLWRLPLDGPAVQGREVSGYFFDVTQARGGIWSPDHAMMVYSTAHFDKGEGASPTIMLAHGDGTQPEAYASEGLFFRTWSPDSRHFICIAYHARGIFVCAPDKLPEPLVTLPGGTKLLDVRWIDAERVLCVHQRGERAAVVQVLHLDGTLSTVLPAISGNTGDDLDVYLETN